jgi:hypothetical protein
MASDDKQAVRHVNCPHCGEINKVVCPVVSVSPRKVKADKEHYWLQGEDDHTPTTCTYCGNSFTVYWYY